MEEKKEKKEHIDVNFKVKKKHLLAISAVVIICVVVFLGLFAGCRATIQEPYTLTKTEVVQEPYEEEETYTDTDPYEETVCKNVTVPYETQECKNVEVPYTEEECEDRDASYSIENEVAKEWTYTHWECELDFDIRNNEAEGGSFTGNYHFYPTKLFSETKYIAAYSSVHFYKKYNCAQDEVTSIYASASNVPVITECEDVIEYRTEEQCDTVTKTRVEEQCSNETKAQEVTKTRTVTKYRNVTKEAGELAFREVPRFPALKPICSVICPEE